MNRLNVLLDPDHKQHVEKLKLAAKKGKRGGLLDELKRNQGNWCPVAAYVLWVQSPDLFGLTALRILLRSLRRRGHLDLAYEVLQSIHQMSSTSSDFDALESLGKEIELLSSSCVLDPKPIRSTNSALVVLRPENQDRIQSIVELLVDQVSNVVVAVEEDGFDLRMENLRSRTVSIPQGCSPAERAGYLNEKYSQIISEERPSIIHTDLPLQEAVLLLRQSQSSEIPFVWDCLTDEAGLLEGRPGAFCEAHPADRDIQMELLQKEMFTEADASLIYSQTWSHLLRINGYNNVFSINHYADSNKVFDINKIVVDLNDISNSNISDTISELIEFINVYGSSKSQIIAINDSKEEISELKITSSVTVLNSHEFESFSQDDQGLKFYILCNAPRRAGWAMMVDRVRLLRSQGWKILAPPVSEGVLPRWTYFNWERRQSGGLFKALQGAYLADGQWTQELSGRDEMGVAQERLSSVYGRLLTMPRFRRHRRTRRSLFDVSGDEVRAWRERIEQNLLSDPYQWFDTKGHRDEDVIKNGWAYAEFSPVKIYPEMNWREAASSNRSWGFHLHAWEFMDPVIQRYRREEDPKDLEWCLRIASSWAESLLELEPSECMAWYDMALAWRSPRLVSLIHLAAKRDAVSDEDLVPLFELALAHQDAHEAEDSFAVHNNHGYYAALGQLVLAQGLEVLPGMNRLKNQGEQRMRAMLETQFLPDGGHSEHSPDYHRMLLGSFERAISLGIIQDSEVRERIAKASEVLGWFVLPNGAMLQFGDSPGRPMVRRRAAPPSSKTQFIMSDGMKGEPEERELLELPQTGYAIVRSPQPKGPNELSDGSYLALMAGFHSRAHKHCDDLSIVWSHLGKEVLVDGGRFGYGAQLPKDSPLRDEGYFYADPERQYVESVVAHNTVAVDGKNHDRRRAPYGSALRNSEVKQDTFHLRGVVQHSGWQHDRKIIFDPGKKLIIEDNISVDDLDLHEYSVFFNFANSLDLDRTDSNGIKISYNGERILNMSGFRENENLELVCGQKEPLRGWRSVEDRTLVPTWSLERRGSFRASHKVVTIFTCAR